MVMSSLVIRAARGFDQLEARGRLQAEAVPEKTKKLPRGEVAGAAWLKSTRDALGENT